MCACKSARSVGGRAEPTSRTFQKQMYVVSQVWKRVTGQRRENETCQFEVETSTDRKPVSPETELAKCGPIG